MVEIKFLKFVFYQTCVYELFETYFGQVASSPQILQGTPFEPGPEFNELLNYQLPVQIWTPDSKVILSKDLKRGLKFEPGVGTRQISGVAQIQ